MHFLAENSSCTNNEMFVIGIRLPQYSNDEQRYDEWLQ